MRYIPLLLLSALLGCGAWLFSPQASSAAEPAGDPDERILRQAKIGTDDATLLEYLRKRSDHDVDLLNVDQLIRQLDDSTQANRDQASQKLTTIGIAALPALRRATADSDREIVRRANLALEEIAKDNTWALAGTAVRLLIRRKPARSAGTLIRYLPYAATDDDTTAAIWYTLFGLARTHPGVYPILSNCLSDPFPARRAVGACILARLGTADHRRTVKKTLTDSSPLVRLRAAQGLLASHDKDCVSTLIDLLETTEIDIAWQAEELLFWLARQHGQIAIIGVGAPDQRKKCKDAWRDWWSVNRARVDFAAQKTEPREPRLLLVSARSSKKTVDQIILIGSNGRPRWTLDNLKDVGAYQLLSGGFLLAAESGDNAIIERDVRGNVLWKHTCNDKSFTSCQQLPNGTRLFAGGRGVAEITPGNPQPVLLGQVAFGPEIVRGLTALPTGQIFAWGFGKKRSIGLINIQTGEPITYTALSDEVPDVSDFCPLTDSCAQNLSSC